MRFFYYISVFSPFIPILFYLLFKPSRKDRELWIIFFYLIFSFAADTFKMVIKTRNGQLGLITVPFFTLLDYGFMFVLFQYLIKRPNVKILFRVVSILYALYLVFVMVTQNANHFTIVSPIETLIVLIFCIPVLFDLMNKQDDQFIYSSPIFWIILAFLAYTSGTLFLYIIRIIDVKEANRWWAINNLCNIIANSLIALAVIINYNQNKSIHPPPKPLISESLEN